MTVRRLALGLYGAAALVAAGAFVCPYLLAGRDDGRAAALADAGLQRVAEAETALFAKEGKFAGFGATNADRRSVLPQLRLGPEFDDLGFDALVDRGSTLQLRAFSRADAVRSGRMPPLLKTVQLTDPSQRVVQPR